jgi:tetratricopeptide (TPR) repeat protein
MFNKIKAFYYYTKARDLTSNEKFLDALDCLKKIPSNTKNVYTYVLQGYVNERLGNIDASFISYDKANSLIRNHKKINLDEELYLKAYIEYGYANIYKVLGKLTEYDKSIVQATSRNYDIKNIKKFILEDFPVIEN